MTIHSYPPEDTVSTTGVAQKRRYVHVQLSDEDLSPTGVIPALEQLHQLDADATFECLLIADNTDTISYYFGTDPSLVDHLESILRGLFPDTYELTQTQVDPAASLPVVSTTSPENFADSEPTTLDSDDSSSDSNDPTISTTFSEPDRDDTIENEEEFAAAELYSYGDRRRDWQTRLRPLISTQIGDHDHRSGDRHGRTSTSSYELLQFPLANVIETMAPVDATVVYQALFQPKSDWTVSARRYVNDIEFDEDTWTKRWIDLSTADDPTEPSREDKPRIDEIETKDARRSFDVNARVVAVGPEQQARRAIDACTTAFSPVSGEFYAVRPRTVTDDAAHDILDRMINRTFRPDPPLHVRLLQRLPITGHRSPAIVTDPTTLPNFVLVDGGNLTDAGNRALGITPGEQTGIRHPDSDTLEQYRATGMPLGRPLTSDDTPADKPIVLPPTLQDLHVAWFGKTGSGKSTALTNAILANHAVTEGADILIDPKGDGFARDYMRAHYAEYGELEDVYYFDCTDVVPALSFFDIRAELAAGIDRTTAVEDKVDHYIEILTGIMGDERFERAIRSPDIIRYLVKALFDPVHGQDAFVHRDLQRAASRMHTTRDPPPVSDPELEAMLGGVAANSKRSFDELMQGVANRIEKIPLDDRLSQLFNHVPRDSATGEDGAEERDTDGDPCFDFLNYLDEDAVIIVDTGALRTESQRVLTLVLLSNLWAALRRRTQQRENDDSDDLPLVNLYLEEASSIAVSDLMSDLLARSRSFGLSVTLAMQFPAQLRQADNEAYAEVLNNVSTVVAGNVAVDRDLAMRFATDEMEPADVGNRLRALRRGQWMVSLPAPFGEDEPRPFLVESLSLPPGHPEGNDPLSDAAETAFEAMLEVVREQTLVESGLDVTATSNPSSSTPLQGRSGNADSNLQPELCEHVRSALPYTKRMPAPVEYDEKLHALRCADCENRYDPSASGMERAITCCHDLQDVDRDDIPICEINLKLTRAERRESDYSDRQLCFLQAVYSVHQRRYSDLEYDIIWDSMVRLQEYVGIESEAIQGLIDDELLVKDCDYPHRLYTVTAEGREEIKVSHREGVAHGHGKGDLSESSLHVLMVQVGLRYIRQEYADNPESEVVQAAAYYEKDDYRFDVVGLNEQDEIEVTLEAERLNHDMLRAVPRDYDKMAAVEPEEAIWIVKSRDAAHDILEKLNEPPEGKPRVEKEYSRTTAPQRFRIDTPGLTQMYAVKYVRDSLLELGPC